VVGGAVSKFCVFPSITWGCSLDDGDVTCGDSEVSKSGVWAFDGEPRGEGEPASFLDSEERKRSESLLLTRSGLFPP